MSVDVASTALINATKGRELIGAFVNSAKLDEKMVLPQLEWLIGFHPMNRYTEIEYFVVRKGQYGRTLLVCAKKHTANQRLVGVAEGEDNVAEHEVSYVKCLRGRFGKVDSKVEVSRDIRMLFRRATTSSQWHKDQTTRLFAESQLCALCAATGKLEIDHVIPFKNILADYLKSKALSLDNICYKKTGELYSQGVDITADWVNYHNKTAVYRLLCRKCNARTACES